jgi:hypothetical protein
MCLSILRGEVHHGGRQTEQSRHPEDPEIADEPTERERQDQYPHHDPHVGQATPTRGSPIPATRCRIDAEANPDRTVLLTRAARLRVQSIGAATLIAIARLTRHNVVEMRLADRFAERSASGMLTRAAGAWLLVGLPVIAARIWWSAAAAITIFVVAVTIYVTAAVRYTHRHPQH